MTVSSTVNRIDHVPDGSTTVFTYDFRVDEATDLVVYADGVEVIGGYSVSGLGTATGGDVTFDVAPASSITDLTFIREVPLTQQTSYPSYGPFPSEAHEAALDKITFLVQQINEQLGRCMTAPINVDPLISLDLPEYAAGGLWMWDPINKKIVTTNVMTAGTIRAATDTEAFTGDPLASDAFINPEQFKKFNGFVSDVTELRAKEGQSGQSVFLLCHTTKGDGGGGHFYWDSSSIESDDNGIVFAVTGVAVGRWKRNHGSVIYAAWYGLKMFDNTSGVSNYTAIRSALKYCITQHPTIPYDGQLELDLPAGDLYIKGNSPFCFNRSELEAMDGAYRYRRGMTIRGTGRISANLILQNNGAQTWFWDNYDGAYSELNRSVASTFTFEGISFKSYASATPTRRYSVAEASQICGFRFYAAGWESFMVFRDCAFQGLDTAFNTQGSGNGDHNTFYSCLFQYIIDNAFVINNDQVVQTRLYATDFIGVHGNVFNTGGNGGGDIKMLGGSVIMYPKFTTSNLPDISATTIRGFYYVDLENHSTSSTLGDGNNKCKFDGLRFEFYDDYQKLVYATRNSGTLGGSINPVFDNCNFINEYNMDAAGNTITAPSTLREFVIVQNNISGNVTFRKCNLNKRHKYVIRDNDMAYLTITHMQFEDCLMYWDASAATLGGGLRERCILDSTDDGSFAARMLKAAITNSGITKTRYVLDFDYNVHTNGSSYARYPKEADMLTAQTAWPYVGVAGLKLYLPEGSVITGVQLYKPAQSPPASTPVNLFYYLADPAATILWSSTNQSEVLAVNEQALLADMYVVQAAPNNYVELKSAGSTGSAQPTGGFAVLTYM